MTLPFNPPLEPMLAEAADDIPRGEGWRYEPKWDGFRCLVFRDGDSVLLESRNGQPLARYFPEVCTALKASLPERAVVDGEIVRVGPKGLDFETLQLRLHPAASRVAKLSAEIPASFVPFDALAFGDEDLRALPNDERRKKLVEHIKQTDSVFLSPHSSDADEAKRWFHDFEGAGCDGLIARRAELPYSPGKRVMVKVKHKRTADCVVGGFREGKTKGTVGALMLGLFDAEGVLHHVGHTSSFSAKEKKALFERLSAMPGASFGAGRTPGGVSRWSNGKDMSWTSIAPTLVCEVHFDKLEGMRFRHASTFLRWREDKLPSQCLYSQLEPPRPFQVERLLELSRACR